MPNKTPVECELIRKWKSLDARVREWLRPGFMPRTNRTRTIGKNVKDKPLRQNLASSVPKSRNR